MSGWNFNIPFLIIMIFYVDKKMSFFSRGSKRFVSGRGQYFWNNNRNIKIRVFVHFDIDLEEFAQFSQTGHLALGPPFPLPPTYAHIPSSLNHVPSL